MDGLIRAFGMLFMTLSIIISSNCATEENQVIEYPTVIELREQFNKIKSYHEKMESDGIIPVSTRTKLKPIKVQLGNHKDKKNALALYNEIWMWEQIELNY